VELQQHGNQDLVGELGSAHAGLEGRQSDLAGKIGVDTAEHVGGIVGEQEVAHAPGEALRIPQEVHHVRELELASSQSPTSAKRALAVSSTRRAQRAPGAGTGLPGRVRRRSVRSWRMTHGLGQEIAIVSGLPRSGTSLVMQMLAAGGLPVLTDDARGPDPDNPRGYFEHTGALALARNPAWLAAARGRAVKLVHALLPHVPAELPCRVVLLERNLAEVLASQSAMLRRRGEPEVAADGPRLERAFGRQLREVRAQLEARPRTRLLLLEHARVIAEPAAAARELAAFLGGGLDLAAMAAVVDVTLYRQRAPELTG
jgi:hypothetical protein